jgi:hypothetical protein
MPGTNLLTWALSNAIIILSMRKLRFKQLKKLAPNPINSSLHGINLTKMKSCFQSPLSFLGPGEELTKRNLTWIWRVGEAAVSYMQTFPHSSLPHIGVLSPQERRPLSCQTTADETPHSPRQGSSLCTPVAHSCQGWTSGLCLCQCSRSVG